MDKKYQIFISSTYEDLKEERKRVQDTIVSMYHIPIGMEMFSAADEEQWEIIKETINSSDYYVLIIAHKYGTIIQSGEDKGISYTEKEYRYAKKMKVPILAFIIDNSVSIAPDKIEKDSRKRKRLESFINEVKTGRLVQWWLSEEDLINKISSSLYKQFGRVKRAGWIRANEFDIEKTHKVMIEMSEEIKLLKDENDKLKEQLPTRKPEIYITVNSLDCLSISIYEEDVSDELQFKPLSNDDGWENIVSREEIDEYNNQLPSELDVERYKKELQFYYRAIHHATDINFTIKNIGQQKARDLRIEIYFPKEIKIYKRKNIDIEKPVKPGGINPIEAYQAKQLKRYEKIFQTPFSHMKVKDVSNLAQINSSNRHYYNGDDSISIRMNSIMNTYSWNINNEYCIVPFEKGRFFVRCESICEEFSQKEIQTIEVIIE